MARTHGKNVDFAYAGVTDAENQASSVTLNFTVAPAEITSFSDAYLNFLAGKPTATLEASLLYDPAGSEMDDEVFADLGGAAQTYDFEPDGTTGYNGYAIITSYSITAPVNGPITSTLSLQHNGGSAAADGLAPTRA